MEIARDEIFGPLVGLLRARDEAHALELANASEYGLSSAVFSRDLERAVRFARQLRAGMTHVNDIPVNDEANAPFGGEELRTWPLQRRLGHRGIHHRPLDQRAARAAPVPVLTLAAGPAPRR